MSLPNEVQLITLIGEGGFGEVFLAEWMGRRVAAKRIKKSYFDNDYNHRRKEFLVKKFKDECQLLQMVKHSNIVEFYRVIAPPGESPIIIMELLDRDLASFIRHSKTEPRVSFSDTVRIMLDVAMGLRYLHKQSIVHRDLSSKNILLTCKKRAKISDLGVAKIFESYRMVATSVPGAEMYAAPEVYSRMRNPRKATYSAKIDIFSFGVVLLEVVVGQLPARLVEPYNEDGERVEEYIRRSEELYKMGPSHPLKNLVETCLENEPESRPTATKIVEELRQHRSMIECSTTSLQAETPHEVRVLPRRHHFDYRFKIVVLGEVGVGKSTIIQRLIRPNEPFKILPRLNRQKFTFDEYFEELQVRGRWVHLHIVDSNGQERFHNIRDIVPQIYRNVKGALIVFDLSCQVTLFEARKWIDLVRSRRGLCIPIILVGNKSDLENLPPTNSKKAQIFAEENNLFYIETSAKSRNNVDEAFAVLTELLIKQHNEQPTIEDDEQSEDYSSVPNPLNINQPWEIDVRRPSSPLPSNTEDQYVTSFGAENDLELGPQDLLVSVRNKQNGSHDEQPDKQKDNKRCCIIL